MEAKLGRLAGRSSDVWLPNFSNFSNVAPPDTCSGSKIGPGATPLTRIPLGPSRNSSSPPWSARSHRDRAKIVGLLRGRADDDGAGLEVRQRRLDDLEQC